MNLFFFPIVADGEDDDDFFCFSGNIAVDDVLRPATWKQEISTAQIESATQFVPSQ